MTGFVEDIGVLASYRLRSHDRRCPIYRRIGGLTIRRIAVMGFCQAQGARDSIQLYIYIYSRMFPALDSLVFSFQTITILSLMLHQPRHESVYT